MIAFRDFMSAIKARVTVILRNSTWGRFPAWSKSRRVSIPIAYRMAFSFAALVLLGAGCLGYLAIRHQAAQMSNQIATYGSTVVTQFAHTATEPLFIDDHLSLEVLINRLIEDPNILGAAIYNEKGRPLFELGEIPQQSLDKIIISNDISDNQAASGESQTAGRKGVERQSVESQSVEWQSIAAAEQHSLISLAAPISFNDVIAGYALVTLSVNDIKHDFSQAVTLLISLLIATTLVALAIAYVMSHRLSKPFRQLVHATNVLASGNYDVRVALTRNDELGQLADSFNAMAQTLKEKYQVEHVLSRFIDHDIAELMLEDLDHVKLGCGQVDASVLFVDIVGYTEMAESLTTHDIVELLNEYLAYFALCSRLFFGTIDKFIGDCAMVIFGAPKPDADHRFHAIACAMVMMRLLERINVERRQQHKPEIKVRIGINSGEMMAGIVGASERMEYTVVGDTVNVASRLSRMSLPGEIILGEAVARDANFAGRVELSPGEQVFVKGRQRPVKTFHIESISPEYERTMDYMIDDILRHRPTPSMQMTGMQMNSAKVAGIR